ncbi:MAG: amino acid adenylation domain-containing protein, partial [bacterium]|nr:amino acid adenylation domain-containing protein [bacterium]
SYFVPMERIPLTPNGKVDKTALPEPRPVVGGEFVAPRDRTEKKLVEIWSQVLNLEAQSIGIDDNFFRMGGHSLKAAAMVSKIKKEFNARVPLAVVFETPTIKRLAESIRVAETDQYETIEPAEEKEYYPLTNPQNRFFLFQRLEPDNNSYNMPTIILLEGPMEKERFESAFKQMIRRHESLRTSFHLVGSEPVQVISPAVPFAMECVDLTGLDRADKEGDKERLTREFVKPFNLSRPPLLRAGLIEMEKEIHLLMVDIHHIVTDGVSMGIFIKEFLALYSGKELPLLPLQYRDYSEWMRTRKKKEPGGLLSRNDAAESPEDLLNLPYDYVRPATSTFEGRAVKFKLGENETLELNALSQRLDVSLYMLLLSVFNLFLAKVSGQEHITVGSPMAGRVHHGLEGLIGLFINTLVLRNSPSGQKTFAAFLNEVKQDTLASFENQDIQYDRLIETITAERDSGRNPLFDVMFVLQNMEMPDVELPGLKVTRDAGQRSTSKFDITLYVEEPENIPVFVVEYNTRLFKEETILRFTGYIKTILSSILKEPGQPIADIDFIPQSEKEQLLNRFNQTAVDYPKDTTIYRLFEEQVEKTPNATLLRSGDRELDYSQLNRRSNQLAHLLRSRGVRANHVVGIMLNRSMELIETLYAVLKAGGTYLPVDPEYPDSRIISMLKESKSSLLITQREILEGKQLGGGDNSPAVILTTELTGGIARQSEKNPEPLSSPDDLIYIIFTSGSTGVPKGAGVFHRGFVNLMNWFVTDFDLDVHDTNLLITSFSFDLTQKNFYASAMSGGTISLPTIRHFEPRIILQQIWDNKITWINCTPSMFAQLVEYCNGDELRQLERLRWVYLGGEPIVMTALLKWLESDYCNGEIVNTYGPTECTDISNAYRVREPRRFLHVPVPIGKPVYNVQNYVLDANGGLLPQGTPGELCIAGDSVGIGYVNDNQLTKEKFITVQPDDTPIYLYRTGDLVKWLPDGNIEFIGRLDHQVKIRGFRIELGEIEKRLLEHDAVKEVLVMAKKREEGDNYLCAYVIPVQGDVVPEDKKKLTPNVLREFLIEELPDYMTPSYFVMLDKMPLNPNGKVDRKALPEPGIADGTGGEYVPPANPTEKQMVELWSEVLDTPPDRISVIDNFFQLGGHSLKAAGLIARIHKHFSIDIPIAQLFSSPTIRGICQLIARTNPGFYSSIQPMEEKEYYPLSSAQKRLFVIHRLDPSSTTYNLPETLQLNGQLNKASFEAAIKALIQRHESLRTSFEIIDGEPVQKVHDHVDFEIGRGVPLWSPLHGNHSGVNGNNSGVNGNNPGTHGGVPLQSQRDFIRPFDLSIAPLLRIDVMEMNEEHFLLFFDMHHIISDGVSMEIFTTEFVSLYSGNALPGVRISYKDYCQWRNSKEMKEKERHQATFWKRELAGEIPVLELPTDYVRPALQSFKGNTIQFFLDAQESEGLKELANREEATLYMVCMAIFNIWLAKLGSREDIIVGLPVSGRTHADLEPVIGMFVNTLAIRNDPVGGKPFTRFLREVKDRTLSALQNQEYPFEDLVDEIVTHRDVSRNPLFDVMFVKDETSPSHLKIPGLTVSTRPSNTGVSKFDLSVGFSEAGERLRFELEYCTALFREDTLLRFTRYFKKIVSDVLRNPNQVKISEIQIISEEEKKQILVDFNNTEVRYPEDKTVHRLFEEQVERMPHRIAVIHSSSYLSYGELNKKAGQLAALLRENGVKTDSIVAIMADRSLEMVISVFAVLKAGGAYLPVTPDLPRERVDYILKDSNAIFCISNDWEKGKTNNQLSIFNYQLLMKNSAASASSAVKSKSANLAYIIYTSGSTGKPKGVMVEHRALVNRLYWFQETYNFDTDFVVLQTAKFTFDVSVCQLFRWMLGGSKLFLPQKGIENEPRRLLGAISKYRVTDGDFVPSMLKLLLEAIDEEILGTLSSLKYIISGADTVSPGLVKEFHDTFGSNSNSLLINSYGPTEAVVDVSSYNCSKGKYREIIPIGRPISNVRLIIRDKDHHMQPVGIAGELCVLGKSLARGYLNKPELTTETFGPAHSSLYKTGDWARWLPDGNIQFLGRIDHQVKVRGNRVELGEIDNRLLKHESIKEALVAVKENETGDKFLCAYVVSLNKDIIPVTVDASLHPQTDRWEPLKSYLSGILPDYMVPSYFVEMERIPLTPNGKVDRSALPEPVIEAGKNYVAPANETEEKLVEIWSAILGIATDKISINDNFFHLGGHSLTAVRLISGIQKALNVEVPLDQVFNSSTIKELSAYIMGLTVKKYISIPPVEERDYYPLSSAQRRLYVLQEMDETSTAYNMPSAWLLEGAVDKRRLEDTFNKLVRRHESLRTSFLSIGGQPVQRVHEEVELEIERLGRGVPPWSPLNGNMDSNKGSHGGLPLQPLRDFVRPFELSRWPLLRVSLAPLEETKYLLMVDMHHVISDGISTGILVKDFMSLYGGDEPPALPLHYKDFSCWQDSPGVRESLERQESYWLKEFAGEIPVLTLPADYIRPAVKSFEGGHVYFHLEPGQAQSLKDYALTGGVTLYMVLLSMYTILLSKLSRQEDIVIGTPVAGRNHSDLEPIMGMFINTLPLRNVLSPGDAFDRFLRSVKTKTLAAFNHQDCLYEDLVEYLVKDRDTGRNPLFDTVFILQNIDIAELQLPGLRLTPYHHKSHVSKFDLTLEAVEQEGNLSFTFEFSTRLFSKETIERFARYFKKIVSGVLQSPGMEIAAIELISQEEKRQLLYDFNDTRTDYPRDKTIHELFEEQVQQIPDHIALTDSNPGNSLTYDQLNRQSGQLARRLIEEGVRSGDIIGIIIERCPEMVTGILGILKAGGAYLPIEPDTPGERIDYMLKDSGTNLLLSWSDGLEVRRLNASNEPTNQQTIKPSNQQTNLAYIMYTSGSTGGPKGVMVEHRNVVRLVSHTDYVEFKPGDRILQTGALSFDASTFEIWGSLLNGLGLYLVSKEEILSPSSLKGAITNFRITTMWMTAPLFNQMSDRDIELFSGLRNLLVGGDVLSPVHINRVRDRFPRLNVINGYGPTENTTFSTTHLIQREYNGPIPIGKPIANSTAYILDKNNHPQPIGVVGELCVGGDGVSRGYLNNPELTNEKFELRTSNFELSLTLYHTGDLARWLPDGVIEFFGRADTQVKVRGFRIELEEIENRLKQCRGIIDAVVIAREALSGGSEDKSLCAYIVTGSEVEVSAIREELAAHLPDFMVPSYFIELDEIPLTPNGKVDRKDLPEPGLIAREAYRAPRNETERKLVAIWAEVLVRDPVHASQMQETIGIDDNFFNLGGHSLKAVQLVSLIHQTFHIKLPLMEIFRHPTISGISRCIGGAASDIHISIQPSEEKEYYPLSSAQRRLYILSQLDAEGTGYNIPALLALEGHVDKNRLENAFKQLIERHQSLRTSFHMAGNQAVQRVHDHMEMEIEFFGRGDPPWSPLNGNHSSINGNNKGSHGGLPLQPQQDFVRPFDLSNAPLLRVGLIKEEETKHLLMVDMHHIISDGTSISVLARDFMSLYSGETLPDSGPAYKDFSQWQNSPTQKEAVNRQQAFWLKQFEGEIPVLNLLTDYTRPPLQSFEGNTLDFRVSGRDYEALTSLSRTLGVTLYMVLLSIFTLFLSKLSGQEDIVVGCPIAGRRHAGLENIIGMFVNTLALRNFPSGRTRFIQFLEQLKNRTLDSFENQDYQYEDLVEKLVIERDTGRNPLFDTMLILQNQEMPGIEIPGLKLTSVPFGGGVAKFDLMLACEEKDGQLACTFEYSTQLFRQETIQRFIRYFKTIIPAVSQTRDVKISGIEIITQEEKQQLLFDFNDTAAHYPEDKTIPRLFEEQVEKTPHHSAVFDNGKILTYSRLNRQSGQLALHLIERGVEPDSIVAVMMERSLDMLISIYGILKAGAAYLPLDPVWPEDRIEYVLKDSNAVLCISDYREKGKNNDRLPIIGYQSLMTPPDLSAPPACFTSKPAPAPRTPHPADLAYILYTSGSTGAPKGSMVAHGGVVNMLTFIQTNYSPDEGDVYLFKTSYLFDVSVHELFSWFCFGVPLALLEPGGEKDIPVLLSTLCRHLVSLVNFVPSMFQAFVEYLSMHPGQCRRLDSLKYIFLGGEEVSPRLVEQFNQLPLTHPIELENLYGPTEATVYTSVFSISQWDGHGPISIGKPLQNVRLYILDKNRKTQPIGVAGELFIAGAGLARGYLNQPELTAERFTWVETPPPGEETSHLRNELPHFWSEISSLRNEISPLRSEISPLRNEISPLWKEISLLWNEISLLRSTISPLRNEISPLRSTVSPLWREISLLWNKISPLRREVSLLRNDISLLWKKISLLRNKISAIRKKISAIGNKMYKTGDLVSWLPDGNIRFLGRLDHQVKVRGYRIELG